jgi:hypothetical protein
MRSSLRLTPFAAEAWEASQRSRSLAYMLGCHVFPCGGWRGGATLPSAPTYEL